MKYIHILTKEKFLLIVGFVDKNNKLTLKSFLKDINSKFFYYDGFYYKKPTHKKIIQNFDYICKKVENID